MNHRDFLQFAKTLASTSTPTPAGYRSAISRSYYAAYHEALEFMKTHARLEPIGKGDRHSQLKAGYMEAKIADAKLIGQQLDTLHTQRKDADYEMSKPGPETQKSASAGVALADQIIQSLQSIARTPPKLAAIVQAMHAWSTTPTGASRLKAI